MKYKLDKSWCNKCDRRTNHRILRTHSEKGETSYINKHTNVFFIIRCLGCGSVSFLTSTIVINKETNELSPESYSIGYPEYDDHEMFLEYDEAERLPSVVKKMYYEVEELFRNPETPILAGIGLRTLLEAVCIQQKVPGKVLKDKIQSLFNSGIISKIDLRILQDLREIGNISAHNIKGASERTLENAFEALMHILKSIYVMKKLKIVKQVSRIKKN